MMACFIEPSIVIMLKKLTEFRKRNEIGKKLLSTQIYGSTPSRREEKTVSNRPHILSFPIFSNFILRAYTSGANIHKERRFFIGGNWKMNGSETLMDEIINGLSKENIDSNVDVVVSPPAVYLDRACRKLPKNIMLAAQNCYKEPKGAFTGEISPVMIKEVGCTWVILGHSERRNIFKEDDELISDKVAHAHSAGIGVIACVGEHLKDREEKKTKDVILKQMEAIAKKVEKWNLTVIAYEPVWAIGTGKNATPEQAQQVHCWIRHWLKDHVGEDVSKCIRIIYGGSVTAENCKELASQKDIDGFLVGGASLKPEFLKIINVLKG